VFITKFTSHIAYFLFSTPVGDRSISGPINILPGVETFRHFRHIVHDHAIFRYEFPVEIIDPMLRYVHSNQTTSRS
jgi:hypothetical protein